MAARILFLAQLLPYPPVCGGTIRSFNTLKRLCRNYDVTLLSFTRRQEDSKHADFLRQYCRDVKTAPMTRSAARNARWAALSLLKGSSFIVDRDYVPEMQSLVDRTLSEQQFDLIYVDHLQMSQYVRGDRGCPKVLDEHNVEWKIIQRIADASAPGPRKWFASIEWPKLRAYELSVCEEYDAVCAVTEQDQSVLQSEKPSLTNVTCVPIGVDTSEFRQVELDTNSRTILSIATMSWPPNIDAIHYFASDIYPLVKERVPDALLVVAGSRPPEEIKSLEKDASISVPGFVEDVHDIASKSAVFIVPLRSGSGMRVKILNAMAMGLPVVSTSIGCEGIGAVDGKHILLADNPATFANHVARLLMNSEERQQLGAAGRNFVIENYAWEVIYPRLDAAIAGALDNKALAKA